MKHFYRLLICVLISSGLYGQTTLTNGMLYDFSVGDTVVYAFNSPGGPPINHTITVLQKSVFVDTLLYQLKDDFYVPASCMTCTPSSGTNSYSFQVTDLTANAEHSSMSNTICTVIHDTSYVNGCGQTVNERNNVFGPTCFEPDMFTSTLIEGVGLFFQKSYGQDPNHGIYSKSLNYYRKVGQPACGGNGMVLNTALYNMIEGVLIFPNPATDNIIILNKQKEQLAVSIVASDGKEVYKGYTDEAEMNIANTFAQGIYFVKIASQTGAVSVKKIAIN